METMEFEKATPRGSESRHSETGNVEDAIQVTTAPELTSESPALAAKVFETTELLEMILLEVGSSEEEPDIKTLLHTQRVNRTFRDTINGSIAIQRDLWFEPNPSHNIPDTQPLTINPLFAVRDERSLRYTPVAWEIYLGLPYETRTICTVDKKLQFEIEARESWRRMLIAPTNERFSLVAAFTGEYCHNYQCGKEETVAGVLEMMCLRENWGKLG